MNLLDKKTSHSFMTKIVIRQMGLPLKELESFIEVHLAYGILHSTSKQIGKMLIQL
jgi:hypothetical protein